MDETGNHNPTMKTVGAKPPVSKEPILGSLNAEDTSSLKKYQDFFVGQQGLGALLKYELIAVLFGTIPGSLGILLRKWFYPYIVKRVGSGALWGRNISLRHPGKIEIGDRVAIDDNCLIDAREAGNGGLKVGNDVLIARDTIIQCKLSWVRIGDSCTIGSQCQLASIGGIHLGKSVMIGGQCYLGGGRYRYDNREIPIAEQGPYSEGPVVIEDDVWIGAGAIVADGVRIGRGSVIGAGAVVRGDVPEFTVVTPHQRLVMLPRGQPK